MPNVVGEANTALIILAGGKATRFPGKLQRPIGDIPMLVRTYCNVKGRYRTYIGLSSDSDPAATLQFDAEILFDRTPFGGPLAALVHAFENVREPRVFVVAGDMPFVQAETLSEILKHWKSGDEAVVALERTDKPQPLLALYDRAAFVRAAASLPLVSNGVKDVLPHLRWRGVALREPSVMTNINTEDQYRAVTA